MNKRIKYIQGFTLIELLVALSIFAIMSAIGWQLFSQLNNTHKRVTVESKKLEELQFAYAQINRDLTAFVNRVGYSYEFEDPNTPNGIDFFSVGLDVFDNQLSFTKKASFDPRLLDADGTNHNPAFERVSYKVKKNQLLRYSSKDADNKKDVPTKTVLLDSVTKIKIFALDPAPTNMWPNDGMDGLGSEIDNQTSQPSAETDANTGSEAETTDEEIIEDATRIPMGVSITFEYDNEPIEWKFVLLKQLPNVKRPKTEKKASDNDKQTQNSSSNNTQKSSSQSKNTQANKLSQQTSTVKKRIDRVF